MGFDGFDNGIEDKATSEKVIDFQEEKKHRAPFTVWTVGGNEYRLRLDSSRICKLEEQFGGQNLLFVVADADNGLPPLFVMLTVIQAAMQKFNHGMTYKRVQELFDEYIEEGGSQTSLFSDVVIKILGASGFFTATQEEIVTDQMKDMESGL